MGVPSIWKDCENSFENPLYVAKYVRLVLQEGKDGNLCELISGMSVKRNNGLRMADFSDQTRFSASTGIGIIDLDKKYWQWQLAGELPADVE